MVFRCCLRNVDRRCFFVLLPPFLRLERRAGAAAVAACAAALACSSSAVVGAAASSAAGAAAAGGASAAAGAAAAGAAAAGGASAGGASAAAAGAAAAAAGAAAASAAAGAAAAGAAAGVAGGGVESASTTTPITAHAIPTINCPAPAPETNPRRPNIPKTAAPAKFTAFLLILTGLKAIPNCTTTTTANVISALVFPRTSVIVVCKKSNVAVTVFSADCSAFLETVPRLTIPWFAASFACLPASR